MGGALAQFEAVLQTFSCSPVPVVLHVLADPNEIWRGMFHMHKHCFDVLQAIERERETSFAAMADGDEDVVHVCGDCVDDLLEEIEIQEWKARWMAETGLGEEVLHARILYLLWLLNQYPAKEEESKEDESKAEGDQKDDRPAGSSTDQLDEKKEDKSKAEGDKEDNNRAEGEKMDPGFFEMD